MRVTKFRFHINCSFSIFFHMQSFTTFCSTSDVSGIGGEVCGRRNMHYFRLKVRCSFYESAIQKAISQPAFCDEERCL